MLDVGWCAEDACDDDGGDDGCECNANAVDDIWIGDGSRQFSGPAEVDDEVARPGSAMLSLGKRLKIIAVSSSNFLSIASNFASNFLSIASILWSIASSRLLKTATYDRHFTLSTNIVSIKCAYLLSQAFDTRHLGEHARIEKALD